MSVSAGGFNSHTLDLLTRLEDGAAARTVDILGQVGGSDAIIDFGNVTSGPAVEQVAYTPADWVVEISALDATTGDESYEMYFILSDNAGGSGLGFQAGDLVQVKAGMAFGDTSTVVPVIGNVDDNNTAPQRNSISVDNEINGVKFRFAALALNVTGTTPIITYTSFLSRTLPK